MPKPISLWPKAANVKLNSAVWRSFKLACMLVACSPLMVWAQLPTINLSYTGNPSGCAPLTINFNISNFAGNSASTTYALNFGDGSPVQNYTQANLPSTVSHTYTQTSCGQVFNGNQNAFGATITATNTSGSTTGTVTPIRIARKPSAAFTSNQAFVCSGANIIFTNTSEPGVTYTGNTCNTNPPFYWQVTGPSAGTVISGLLGSNNGFAANIAAWNTGTSSLTMQFTTPGSYQMQLSIGNSCGIDDTTIEITVVNGVIADAGADQSVCLNSAPLNLTATPANVTWSGLGVTTGGVFTPSTVGTFTLTYSYVSGNCNASDTKIVTVLPLPSVTVADAIICAGQSTTLTANGSGATTPYTYAWSPATGLSATTGASVTANPSATQTYTVTITSANTCTSTDQATVTVTPLPIVNAGPDANVCNTPNPYTLTGFSPAGGTWSGPGVTVAGVYTPSGVGTITLTYTVTQNGCTASDQVVLTVANPTIPNAGADQSVCLNSTPLNLTATPANGTWSGTGVTAGGVFTPSTVGTFTLTYSVGSGNCAVTDTKVITVLPLPTVTLPVSTICAGQSTLIAPAGSGGSAPYSYSWSPATGLSATTGDSVFVTLNSTTSYTLTVSSSNGCSALYQSTITVIPSPLVNAGSDIKLCNTPIPYILTGYSPAGGTWSGTGVTAAGVFTPSGVGTVTLTYTVTQNGCSGSDQRVINVGPIVNAGIDQSICLNSVPLNLMGSPAGGTWSGTGVTSAGVFTPTSAGNVTLTYNVTVNNCGGSDTKVITVLPLPSVNVADATYCAGQSASLTAIGYGAQAPYTYSWSPATGLSATSGASVTASPTSTQTYTVTITSANSCSSTDQATVTVISNPQVNAGNDLTVCSNSAPLQLSGFSPEGGFWSGAGVSSTGIFTPSNSGNVVLSYSICGVSDEITVSVIDGPAVYAGPDLTVCYNASPITLSGTPAGGTWSGTGVTSAGVYTPNSAGTFNLSYSYTSGECTVSDVKTITVTPELNVSLPNYSICEGNSATLNATVSGGTAPYTYNWSPDGSLSSINGATAVAEPSGSTGYQITVSDANNCSANDNTTVTVVPLPQVNAGSNISLCYSNNATALSGFSPAGGTWSGIGVSASGQFTPSTLGTNALTYSVTQNGCTATDAILVEVIALPVANAGPDLYLCQSTVPYPLQGLPAGGTWSGIYVNNNVISLNMNASGVLTYTVVENGCIGTDQISVSISDTLNVQAGNDFTMCVGEAIQLNGFPSGGYWAGADGLNASGVFAPLHTQVALLSYVISNTNCPTVDDVMVLVADTPSVTFNLPAAVFCTADTDVPLSGGNPEGGTYSGEAIANNRMNPSLLQPGSYVVAYDYTAASGCTSRDTALIRIEACTGMFQIGSITQLRVFPNPGKGMFHIEVAKLNAPAQLFVYNSSGELVATKSMNNRSSILDMSLRAPGIYFVRIEANGCVVGQQKMLVLE